MDLHLRFVTPQLLLICGKTWVLPVVLSQISSPPSALARFGHWLPAVPYTNFSFPFYGSIFLMANVCVLPPLPQSSCALFPQLLTDGWRVMSHSISWLLSSHPIWFTWWDSWKAGVAMQQHSKAFLLRAVKDSDLHSDAPSRFSPSEPGQLFLHVATHVLQLMEESTLHVMGLLCCLSSLFNLNVKA